MSNKIIQEKIGKLSLVATPIGNLEDITYRAVRVLSECDYIVCEDTRTTQRLLERYNIKDQDENKSKDDVQKNKTLLTFHANSTDREINKIINLLQEGKHLCYVSDAGTPTISDPGVLLVNKIREINNKNTWDGSIPLSYGEGLGERLSIESIPGPSAVTTAYSLSGAVGNNFIFWGFMPHKKGRETMIKSILENSMTSIVYESVHRVEKLLESFNKFENQMSEDSSVNSPSLIKRGLGGVFVPREYVVCRELTKIYEEVAMGEIQKVINYFKNNPDKVRGEFVIVIK